MAYGVLKALIGTLSICVISSGAFLNAQCSIDTIIVNGRVEHAPSRLLKNLDCTRFGFLRG